MKTKLLLLGLSISGICWGQNSYNTKQIDAFVKETFSKHPAKAISISMVNGHGEVIYDQSLGQHQNATITSDTPLPIGSVSKVITTFAIAVLQDRELIHFDDLVIKYISDLENQNPSHYEKLTLRHLLHHYSGFSQKSGYEHEIEYNGDFSKVEIKSKPGEQPEYSSSNAMLLGAIIEKVTGKSYSEFIEKEIFMPLNMTHSFVPKPERGNKMAGYTFAFGKPVATHQMEYGKYVVPAGYIISTASDIAKFNAHLLGSDTTLVSNEIKQQIFTPYNQREYGYGMGWGIGTIAGVKAYSHEGMTKISNAFSTILPEQGVAICIITNTNSGPFYSITSELTEGITSIVSNGQVKESMISKELIFRLLLALLMLKIIASFVMSLYKWLLNKMPKQLFFNRKTAIKLISDGIPLIILIVIPQFIGVSVQMLCRIMPDLGYTLLLGGITAIPLMILNNMNASITKKV